MSILNIILLMQQQTQERLTLESLLSYIMKITEQSEVVEDIIEEEQVNKLRLLEKWGSENLLNFGEKFLAILTPFEKNYYRTGLIHTYNKNNISLLYCVLYCIKTDFLNISNHDRIVYIHKLVDKLITDSANYIFKDYGRTKKSIRELIKSFDTSNVMVYLLADYFNINILIFDHDKSTLFMIYPENTFNKYKPTIILSFLNDYYEPITDKSKNIFTYSDDIIKSIIETNITKKYIKTPNLYRDPKKINMKKIIIDAGSLDKYLPSYNKNFVFANKFTEESDIKLQLSNVESDKVKSNSDDKTDTDKKLNDELENDIKNIEKIIKITDKVNSKMKLDKIHKIASQLNISLVKGKYKNGNYKYKTKAELCKEINNNIQ